MKRTLAIFFAMIIVIITLHYTQTEDNEMQIELRLADLCSQHKEIPCEKIKTYCLESLKFGHDCYILR